MEHGHDVSLLADQAASIGVHLTAGQLTQFQTYLWQLLAWNQAINLTSITSPEEIITKHFIDSLAVLQVAQLKADAALLDVGSGAGFPGIPLKIIRPDLHLTLVEPAHKKVSFLHFIIGCLKLDDVAVHPDTFEQFVSRDGVGSYDYVTTRALRVELVLNHSHRGILSAGGKIILYTSQLLDRNLLRSCWIIEKEKGFDLPRDKGRRTITVIVPSS